jgi:hypothetical protein
MTTEAPDNEEFTTEYDNDYGEDEYGIGSNAIQTRAVDWQCQTI